MMRPALGALTLALAAVPLAVHPTWPVLATALAGALVCGGAVVAVSIPLLTAGATVLMVAYALALWLSRAPSGVPSAVAFAVALLLLVEVGDLHARGAGAPLGGDVLAAHVRRWLLMAAAGAAAIAGLAGLAAAVRLALAPALGPYAVALGTLGALGAALAAATLGTARARGEEE
jgi:hypothetical protein